MSVNEPFKKNYASQRRFMSPEEKKAHDRHLMSLRQRRAYLREKEADGRGEGYSEEYMEKKELKFLRLKYYTLTHAQEIQERKMKERMEIKYLKKENIYLYKMVDNLTKELEEALLMNEELKGDTTTTTTTTTTV